MIMFYILFFTSMLSLLKSGRQTSQNTTEILPPSGLSGLDKGMENKNGENKYSDIYVQIFHYAQKFQQRENGKWKGVCPLPV